MKMRDNNKKSFEMIEASQSVIVLMPKERFY